MERYIVGMNRRHYPCEDGSLSEIKAILVQREDGKYIGYIAGVGRNEFVADCGNQMSFNEAKSHFPELKEEEYSVL